MRTKHILDHLISSLLLLFTLLACRAQDPSAASHLKTHLVDSAKLFETFESYQEKSEHCRRVEGRSRVMITGFGLFGDSFNISGLSTMSMANPNFWPEAVDLSKPEEPDPDALRNFARHDELDTSHGGLIEQRTLTIDGRDYEVCFLYLDVRWDLAASIILHESRVFAPDLVIMSGMNGSEKTRTIWESGAINLVGRASGYDAEGIIDADNRPVDSGSKIVENDPLAHKLVMSWKAEELAQSTLPLIAKVDPSYRSGVGQARSSNDYICNNVSYAVMSGLSGKTVKLASELIVFEAESHHALVGFLHYPSDASRAGTADHGLSIFRWNQVLAQTIKTSLEP